MTEGTILKACACLVDARGRLLVFHHPGDRNMQLPKGTIEAGEAPEDAVRRELLEESGIHYTGALEPLGTMERYCEAGIEGNTHRHPQLWHLFLMRAAFAAARVLRPRGRGQPRGRRARLQFQLAGARCAAGRLHRAVRAGHHTGARNAQGLSVAALSCPRPSSG